MEPLCNSSAAGGRWSPQALERKAALSTRPCVCFTSRSKPCPRQEQPLSEPAASRNQGSERFVPGHWSFLPPLAFISLMLVSDLDLCFNDKQKASSPLCVRLHGSPQRHPGCAGALSVLASHAGVQFGGCSQMSASQKGNRAALWPGEKRRKGWGESCDFCPSQRTRVSGVGFLRAAGRQRGRMIPRWH